MITPDELEARRQDVIDALPLRHKIARWWDIHGLPLAATVGVFLLAGVTFLALLRFVS